MQIISNRFEICSASAPIFAASAIVGEPKPVAHQLSIPTLKPGETRGSATFSTLTVNLKPLSASNLAQKVVPLTIEVGDAVRTKIADIPFSITVSKSGEITLTSEDQKTPWRFTFRVNSQKNQISVSFTLDYGGLSIAEALEGATFYEALAKGGNILIKGINPITGGQMPLVKGEVPTGAYKSNAKLVALLEHLRFIEIQTKSEFKFPTQPISVDEANNIAGIANVLRTGHATSTVKTWVSLTPISEANRALESFKDEMSRPMAVHFREQVSVIFGEHIPLGPVTLFCDQTYITAKDFADLQKQLENSAGRDTVNIRFTPLNNCPIEARYINWLNEDEAAQLKQLPMYQRHVDEDLRELKLQQINVDYAVNLLQSWYDEDDQEQRETWQILKPALEEDRLSDRTLFT